MPDPDPWVGRWQRDIAAATAPAHDQSGAESTPDRNGEALGRKAEALPIGDRAEPDQAVTAAGVALLERWQEPHRHYHDLAHLSAVLDAVDLLAVQIVVEPADRTLVAAVRLAAWFHDAVYAGRPGQDEADSAALAVTVLTALALPRPLVAEVERLVLLTVDHTCAADDLAGALLSDADLAVLGSDGASYLRYAAAVREEYAHVPDPDFRAGRAAVLRRLLATEPLYRTEAARRRWERTARANLSAELTVLTS